MGKEPVIRHFPTTGEFSPGLQKIIASPPPIEWKKIDSPKTHRYTAPEASYTGTTTFTYEGQSYIIEVEREDHVFNDTKMMSLTFILRGIRECIEGGSLLYYRGWHY